MSTFALDPRLAADTLPLLDLPLSTVLMMHTADHPWLILVPRRPDLREIIDLVPEERHCLLDEIARVSEVLKAETGADKLNVGALGNVVAQLHVHVIARFVGDPAWPSPVWGRPVVRPLADDVRDDLARRLRARLA